MGELVGGVLFLIAIMCFFSGFLFPPNFLLALLFGFLAALALGDPR